MLLNECIQALHRLGREWFTAGTLVVVSAVSSLTLVAVATFVDAVMLRPLPYKNADNLYLISRATTPADGPTSRWPLDKAQFESLAGPASPFAHIAVHAPGGGFVAAGTDADALPGHFVSESLFEVLGVEPLFGRVFSTSDVGGAPVAVVSFRSWQRLYEGSPTVLGRELEHGDTRFRIIGVMPPDFAFPDGLTDVWAPLPTIDRPSSERQAHLFAIGVLRSGVSPPDAQRALDALGSSQQSGPARGALVIEAVRERTTRPFRIPVTLLVLVTGLAVLVALATVLNVSLSRSLTREKELWVRRTLGASTWSSARPFLIEGGIVGVAAGVLAAAGLSLVLFQAELLRTFGFPRLENIVPSKAASFAAFLLAFGGSTAAVTFTGIAVGGRSRHPRPLSELCVVEPKPVAVARSVLLMAQVALSVLLSVVAAVLAHRMYVVTHRDLGFDPDNVLVASLNPRRMDRVSLRSLATDVPRISDHIVKTLVHPKIISVGVGTCLPALGGRLTTTVAADDDDGRSTTGPVRLCGVNGNYFGALGIASAVRFDGAQRIDHDTVLTVDKTFATSIFGSSQRALTRPITLFGRTLRIDDVVMATRHDGLLEEAPPIAYLPLADFPGPLNLFVIVRVVSTDDDDLKAQLHTRLLPFRDRFRISPVRELNEVLSGTVARLWLAAAAAILVALLTGLMATLGVIGVVTYSAQRRVHEMAIRIALGAQPHQLVWPLVRRTMVMMTVAVTGGLTLGYAVIMAFRVSFFGIDANNAGVLCAVAVLWAGAGVAALAPAMRWMGADPVLLLREH